MVFRATTAVLAMLAALTAPHALFASSVAGADCVPASQNCTANDAAPVIQDILEFNGEAFDPDDTNFGCTDGDTFSIKLRVNYTENSTGQATRFDLATFVGENGGDAIGGATCSVDYLSPVTTGTPELTQGDGPFRDDDGDACGDVRNADKPTNDNLVLSDILCRDSDGNGRVDISYLVAWDNNAQGACDAAAIAQGDTSSLLPNTPSKCLYEADADLGILVENPPSIRVVKTAAPTTAEEGETITYTVAIENTSDATDPVTIDTITDSLHGDLNGQGDCTLPQTIAPGDTYSCRFTVTYDTAGTYDNVVTASGEDDEGEAVTGQDGASVEVSPTPPPPNPAIEVIKSAAPEELDEPGGTVTYTVAIQNTGNVDGLAITALADDVYNDITTTGHDGITSTDCTVPQTLDVGDDPYSCEFTVDVDSQPGSITDTITATWSSPQGGGPTTDSNPVTVTINDLASSIDVTKTASPETITTPGGDVTYTVTLDNPSVADTITVEALNDDKFGDLSGTGDCQVPQTLVPGGSYTCTFTQSLTLEDGEEHANTVTASGTDDDGAAVEGSDGSTVTGERPPSVDVVKTAAPTSAQVGDTVTYKVEIVNTSVPADPVTITTLTDNVNGGGDNSLGGEGTCTLPQTIQPAASYSCEFDVTYQTADTYNDVVTASGTDDDGEAVSGQDDASVVVSPTPPPPDPRVEVTKAGAPLDLDEPGGTVTYSVDVVNTGNVDGLAITALADDVYNDITTTGHDGIVSTDCTVPQTLNVGATYGCSFTVDVVSQPGSITDTITATWNPPDEADQAAASNPVTVTIRDVPSDIGVTKTAAPQAVAAPGGDVTYTVTLENASVDEITIDTLSDDKFGDLNGAGDCQVPQTIPPGGDYSCSFTQLVTVADGAQHENTVTAAGTDDDGAAVEASASATVTGTAAALAAPIPTLAHWGLVVLAGILALLGLGHVRQRT